MMQEDAREMLMTGHCQLTPFTESYFPAFGRTVRGLGCGKRRIERERQCPDKCLNHNLFFEAFYDIRYYYS